MENKQFLHISVAQTKWRDLKEARFSHKLRASSQSPNSLSQARYTHKLLSGNNILGIKSEKNNMEISLFDKIQHSPLISPKISKIGRISFGLKNQCDANHMITEKSSSFVNDFIKPSDDFMVFFNFNAILEK